MPKLNITGDPEAGQLLEESPFALLMAMLLDQQIPMEQAFLGPKKITERLHRIDLDQQIPMSSLSIPVNPETLRNRGIGG